MGVFTMPSLGADMAAGTLVEWLKKPGDTVTHGDIIAVVETDKGAIEVEVFEDGEIGKLMVEPGTKVPVGTALASIHGAAGEPVDRPTVSEPLSPVEIPLAGASMSEAPIETPAIPSAQPSGDELRVSPAARQLAANLGVDLAKLRGTGPDGAVQLADVEAEIGRPQGRAAVEANQRPDLSSMRRAIAAAMARSKREIPHYYLTHRFDISATVDWIERYNSKRPPPERLLLGAALLKSVALALTQFPEFNGYYHTDQFVPAEAIHVGSAIAIRGGGLAAPAIRTTDTLSLAELMVRLRDLVARTRRGQFRSSEIGDPTITVSSLGERGVESLFPVIYPPQVAIIGFGSVQKRPWAEDDALAIRSVMTATLAGDHRVNDGHRGALLLRRIEELLLQPEAL